MIRRLLLATFLLVPAAGLAQDSRPASDAATVQAPVTPEDTALQQQLEEVTRGHRGKVALFAKNLRTGAWVGLAPDQPVQTASVIKLPIMYEIFARSKEGKLDLNDKLLYKPASKVEGSGVLQFLKPGLELTVEDLTVLMTVLSDNTATNMLLELIGTKPVNDRMQSLGLKLTTSFRRIGRPEEGPQNPELKRWGIGRTTPREMARLLEIIDRCELGDQAVCRRMIEILRNQQHRDLIPRYIETVDASEVPSAIANKTGSLNAVRNDVGLVYTKQGTIVISVFTYQNEDQSWTADNKAELLVGQLAKVIMQNWAPRGVTTKPEETKPSSTPATKPKP